MPIYEFKCISCGHVFEALVRSSDPDASLECPACSGRSLDRLLSTFAKCGVDVTGCAPAGSKFS